ncbi:MAG: MFS transporter [Burkholderiales bacterium]|nr:MFS transporter [Burkholderiales bacterium]MDE2287789.1 MFS transporter [Burkholderiales bacterium]MDE2608754.1 MFS transporter [Burkholderiales bacterium]
MTPSERRASASLAAIFALRMLGLFLIMPVFTVYAKTVPGGNNTVLIGLAIGIYGFTQALLYIPYGWLSDRLGRKPVIVFGLVIFALGSFVAALSHDILWIIVGRAIQGAGAISSAVIALVADLTSEAHRTKAMAMIGGSIGMSFALAIVAAPTVYHWLGMGGLFGAIGILAIAAIFVVIWVVPNPPAAPKITHAPFREVLHNPELLRLNFGVFVLHATQTALFVVMPRMLEAAGIPVTSHWKIYLPVMFASFIVMIPAVIAAEKRGKMKAVLLGSIGLVLVAQFAMAELPPTLLVLTVLLFIYFAGFNVLEASQPSLVSKLAPGARKGAATGIYNTTQALGLASGGVLGGWLLKHHGQHSIFFVCAGMALLWLIIAGSMKAPAPRKA